MKAMPKPTETAAERTANGVYFEVHGEGVPLFLGFPVMASHAEIFGEAAGKVREGFLNRLTDRYCVLIADYPGIGRSSSIPPSELTLERACADMLAVADAAGFTRFAWWGGTFGAVIGMALAARSQRVTALVNAGWPPLGMPFQDIVRSVEAQLQDPPAHARVILREPSQYAQWATIYGSVPSDWEPIVVARIRCPKTVIYGADAETSVGKTHLPLASMIRLRRAELEALGWRVTELTGRDSAAILDPAAIVPAGRAFLDEILPSSNTAIGERS